MNAKATQEVIDRQLKTAARYARLRIAEQLHAAGQTNAAYYVQKIRDEEIMIPGLETTLVGDEPIPMVRS